MEWSPFARERYTVQTPEGRAGPGVHTVLSRSCGAWNFYWLSDPIVDQILGWHRQGWRLAAVSSTWAPLIEASLGVEIEGQSLEMWAGQIPALEFCDLVKKQKVETLSRVPIYTHSPLSWLRTLRDRARSARSILELASSEKQKVVVVDFASRRAVKY